MDDSLIAPLHGGPDAQGTAPFDFSTNANACGPCPQALQAIQQADYARYPDPAYTALQAQLAAFHGLEADRVVIAASASEAIHRITAWAVRSGIEYVHLPAHSYGDYARAAQHWGLQRLDGLRLAPSPHSPALHWACEPSSPLGHADPALVQWAAEDAAPGSLRVLDCAYAPLRLHGHAWQSQPKLQPQPMAARQTWQLWTPNKALGLTGVRAAYLIAPEGAASPTANLQALAPSWPLGAAGVALLTAWVQPQVQDWLQASCQTLAQWKAGQQVLCQSLGWNVLPGSLANYFCIDPGLGEDLTPWLQALRSEGIKLRDCASFGLPGHVRLGVLPPSAQQALEQAVHALSPHFHASQLR